MPSALPANAACFQAPDAANPHYRFACGGIVAPRYHLIPAGTRLFRFGHSVDRGSGNDIPRAVNHTSPWWFGEEDFKGFLARPPGAAFSSYDFNAQVRARLAVVHQFGQADRIVEARTTAPLGCFAGKGKPIMEDPATGKLKELITEGVVVWLADPVVTQFYIPGFRTQLGATWRDWIASDVFDRSMRILRDFPAHEYFTLTAAG